MKKVFFSIKGTLDRQWDSFSYGGFLPIDVFFETAVDINILRKLFFTLKLSNTQSTWIIPVSNVIETYDSFHNLKKTCLEKGIVAEDSNLFIRFYSYDLRNKLKYHLTDKRFSEENELSQFTEEILYYLIERIKNKKRATDEFNCI